MTYDGCFPRLQHPGPTDQLGMLCDQSGNPLPKRDGPWECAGVRGITWTPARFQIYIPPPSHMTCLSNLSVFFWGGVFQIFHFFVYFAFW